MKPADMKSTIKNDFNSYSVSTVLKGLVSKFPCQPKALAVYSEV